MMKNMGGARAVWGGDKKWKLFSIINKMMYETCQETRSYPLRVTVLKNPISIFHDRFQLLSFHFQQANRESTSHGNLATEMLILQLRSKENVDDVDAPPHIDTYVKFFINYKFNTYSGSGGIDRSSLTLSIDCETEPDRKFDVNREIYSDEIKCFLYLYIMDNNTLNMTTCIDEFHVRNVPNASDILRFETIYTRLTDANVDPDLYLTTCPDCLDQIYLSKTKHKFLITAKKDSPSPDSDSPSPDSDSPLPDVGVCQVCSNKLPDYVVQKLFYEPSGH